MASEFQNKSNFPVHVKVPDSTPLFIHVVKADLKSSKYQRPKKAVQKPLVGNSPKKGPWVPSQDQGPKKVVQKPLVGNSPKKEPWVPPPARTTRKAKSLSTTDTGVLQVNIVTEETYILEELDDVGIRDDNFQIGDENKENSDVSYITNLNDTKVIDSGLESGDKQTADTDYIQLESMKKELELMVHHCNSLQSLLQFLERKIPKMLFIDREPFQGLISSANQLIKECRASCDLVQSHLNPSDSSANVTLQSIPQYLLYDMEYALSKLLESYEHIGFILKLVLENEDKMGISALCTEQESLRKTVETMQNDFLTREARIQELENQLSISQAHVSTLKMNKTTLEDTRFHLLKELTNKESQIETLNSQLQKLLLGGSDHKQSDRLLEVMEEIKQQSEAEKEALKKAVKYQKNRAEQNGEVISQLQTNLQEKEDLIYQIAGERDEWKVKMTVTTNQLTELQSQVAGLKKQSENLQLLLDEGDSAHRQELSKLNEAIDKKSVLLEELSKKNDDMKNVMTSLEERCTETETELKNFQKIYNDVVSAIYPQNREVQDKNDAPVKTEALVNAMHEVKAQLITLREMNEQLKDENVKSMEEEKELSSDSNLLSLIQGMKQEVQILRKTFQQVTADKERADEVVALKDEVIALKEKYTLAAEENHKLVAKIENLERRGPVGNLFEEKNGVNKIQATLNEKSYENNQLYNKLIQNSEEFQKQIKGLRDQLYRQEQLNSIKILKLEDELHARKREINTLESRNHDEEGKRIRRVTELQDRLDEASANNQSLQKYIQFLKSSYLNVFGKL